MYTILRHMPVSMFIHISVYSVNAIVITLITNSLSIYIYKDTPTGWLPV